MRVCPNCHESVGDDPFCPNCGCRLPDPAPASNPAPAPNPAPVPNSGPGPTPISNPNPYQNPAQNPSPTPNTYQNPASAPGPQPYQAPNPAPGPNPGPAPGPFSGTNPAPGPNPGQDPFAPAAAPSVTSKPPKKPGKVNVLLIAGCAAAVLVVVLLAVLLWPKSAAAKFEDFQRDKLLDPALDMVVSLANKAQKAGLSTDLTITAEAEDRTLSRFLDDSSVELKLDLKKNKAVVNAALNFMGSELLTGALTYDDGVVGFQLPEVDDAYYTLDAMALAREVLGLDEAQELPDISAKDLRKMADGYLDEIFKTVNKDNIKVEKDESVKYAVLRGRTDCTVYTFKPSATDVEDLIVRIAGRLEGDKQLLNLLVQTGRFTNKPLSENEVRGLLEDAADDMRDEAKDLGRQVKAAGFEWVLAVEGKTVRSVTLTVGDETYGFETDGTMKSGMDFAVYYESDWGVQPLLQGDLRRDGKELEGSVSAQSGEAFDVEFEIDLGKTSPLGFPYGSYSFSYEDYWSGELRADLEVESAKGGADHILTLGGDALEDELDGLEITVYASKKGTAKKPKEKATDISDYTPEELQDLFEELGYDIGRDLMDEFGGLFY